MRGLRGWQPPMIYFFCFIIIFAFIYRNMEPSREDLLELLVSGGGMIGGAKKKIPPGLKKWHAFRKKHPNLTIKQQSKLYQKVQGRGVDEDDEDDEYELYIEGGKVRRRKKRKSTRKRRGKGVDFETVGGTVSYPESVWRTKTVKDIEKQKTVGHAVLGLLKKHFKAEWNRAKRVSGAGATEFDFSQYARSDTGKTQYGKTLTDAWDVLVKAQTYESDREKLYATIGGELFKAITPENVYLFETGLALPPPPTASSSSSSSSP